MKRILGLLFLGACLAAPPAQIVSVFQDGVDTPKDDEVNYRLDKTFYPIEYTISLKTYLLDSDKDMQFFFNGECSMLFKTNISNLNTFTIHANNLTSLEFKLYLGTAEINNVEFGEPDKLTNKLKITLKTGTFDPQQTYTLKSTYLGYLGDDMHGFYKSQYEDDNGNKKWLASTQFQTHHARRAFPCFDEPWFKAEYKISINRYKQFNVAANTRLASSTKIGDRYIDVFEPTPKMSTYIIAFLVSEFLARSDGNYLVHARPEFYGQTKFAAEASPVLLETLNNFTNIKYQTIGGGDHKMAMAAIPDFSAGAMENWGLLTYRERSLLFQEGESMLSYKQSIAGVIAHEEAHMWFGDLVTCEWWGYTWLNEGFARHATYFTTHDAYPYFEKDKQFPVDQMQSVFGMDSLPGVYPMSDPSVETPSELGRMFNSISYSKGAAFIRMMQKAMGQENYLKSIRQYLRSHEFNNTVPEDLFRAWEEYWPVDSKDISVKMFKSWTEQVGYPVIKVEFQEDKKSFKISQKRFLLKEESIDTTSDRSLLYYVPITYTTSSEKNFTNTETKVYLLNTTDSLTVSLSSAVDWVMLNIQQVGYYRVFYDEKTLHAIHHALSASDHSGIHENNRAQYVDDILAFTRAGMMSYEDSLKILEFIENDQNYLPWTSALNGLSTVGIRMGHESDDKEQFRKYILATTQKIYNTLGFDEKETDSILTIYNRNKILSWSCKYQNQDCITKAKSIFKNLKDNGKPIPVNIRPAVYCTALREGNEADYDFIFKKWQKEHVATEQTLLINVMGCVKGIDLVSKHFDAILKHIRSQDRSSAMSSLYSENDENVDIVFDLVTAKYEEVDNAFGGKGQSASILSAISSRFTTEEQQKKLENFMNKDEIKTYYGSSHNILVSALNNVKENLAWSSKHLGPARKYFKERNSATLASISLSLLASMVMFALSN